MKLVIVGGVAGGAAAAARARRLDEQAEIIMFERGEYISFANCGLPYYAGGLIKKRSALLAQTPESFKQRFNVEVRTQHLVEHIEPGQKTVTVRNLKDGTVLSEHYDYLILSPGAEPIVPPFEGADLPCVHRVRTIPDIEAIKATFDGDTVKNVIVIGGGFIGLEMAENIRERDIGVSLVEMLDQVMPPFDKEMAVILARELVSHGIHLYCNDQVMKIEQLDAGVTVETASGKKLPADMVIMTVGVRPEAGLARAAGLKIGSRGIVANRKMQTSDPSIFAVGDAVETHDPITGASRPIALAGPAAKQARVAVNTIFGLEDEYTGTIGTSVVKVFALTAAMTGASGKALKASGIRYEKLYTYPANHAGYYPGASRMAIKVLFSPEDGRLLGAQIIGGEGVDKRIDILAVAVKHRMTVNDLAGLELGYAPPYGSAKDPINLVGMAAVNHLSGLSKLTYWDALTGEEFLLDVRTPKEVERGSVPGAVSIPVDGLRAGMTEVPKDRRIAVFCQSGVRAHVANRILVQHGYDTVNISGGYLSYLDYRDAGFADMAHENALKKSV